MKSNELRKLIKEELAKALNEKGTVKQFNPSQLKENKSNSSTPSFLKDLTPGKYQVEYKYKDQQGDISNWKEEFSISQTQIDEEPNKSIKNYLSTPQEKVLSIYSLNKL